MRSWHVARFSGGKWRSGGGGVCERRREIGSSYVARELVAGAVRHALWRTPFT